MMLVSMARGLEKVYEVERPYLIYLSTINHNPLRVRQSYFGCATGGRFGSVGNCTGTSRLGSNTTQR
jgi:hypothetical protein